MLKRIFDLLIVLGTAPLWAPVFLVVALVVRLNLGKPVVFRQTRAGINGEPFDVYKFRSMTNERDGNGELCSDERRTTRLGKFLRATSLDEIPQLLNILRGDLSLVGPRPLYTRYIPLYTETQAQRLSVMPGITGWAQVNGRNALSWDEKFKLDVWYVQNRSFLLDLKIIFLTVLVVLNRSGVNQSGSVTMEEFKGSSGTSKQ